MTDMVKLSITKCLEYMNKLALRKFNEQENALETISSLKDTHKAVVVVTSSWKLLLFH